MEQEEAEKYWALLIGATTYAANICATIEGRWEPFLLGEAYDARFRGPWVAPAIWPEYRLHPTITVATGAQPPRAGIYLPDLHDSCLQFLIDDMPAPETLVFRGKRDLAHPVTDVVYGQENSFDRLPCRWTLVERATDELKH